MIHTIKCWYSISLERDYLVWIYWWHKKLHRTIIACRKKKMMRITKTNSIATYMQKIKIYITTINMKLVILSIIISLPCSSRDLLPDIGRLAELTRKSLACTIPEFCLFCLIFCSINCLCNEQKSWIAFKILN